MTDGRTHEPVLPEFEYDVPDALMTGSRTATFRVRERGGQRTLLLRRSCPGDSAGELMALNQEAELLALLDVPCRVVPPKESEPAGLLMADPGGRPLPQYISGEGMELSQSLRLARGLVQRLQLIHSRQVVHCGVSTPAVLFNKETGGVELMAYSLATRIPRDTGWVHPGKLEGRLPYISPEQTGRMNRAVDYRSDFYSVGVTLYEVFSGKLPFEGHDPVELVHAHIAQAPRPLHEVADIPPVVSRLVSKLLAKNAEDRYQNDIGILDDLQTCIDQLSSAGKITTFDLGGADVLERFRVPQKALDAAHGELLPSVQGTGALAASSDGGIDLASVLKAARILSGEIEIDKLLQGSMAVILENAGAERGLMLLQREGSFKVASAADVHGTSGSSAHAQSIVGYCRRTREAVVLEDATTSDLFASDPHIKATRPRSVLAMPLMQKGHLAGVLYLENSLSAGAFDPGRVQVLEALSAQLAVSLENATIYHNMETLVEQRTAQLAEAKEIAENANKAKSVFLASMSHELRTPLNAIMGYSELVMEELEDDGVEGYSADLNKINWAGKHLLSLINDILDLSKIEAGKIELYLEEFSLGQLVEQVVTSVQPLVNRNSNDMVVDCPEDVGTMYADQLRVRQILVNLISNAAKFTEKGTITLKISRDDSIDGGSAVFEVSDSGIGMSSEQLAKVFEPFRQADATTTKKYGGTGLGLTISQRFCQMMGGIIQAESRAGVGTSFEVTLPVRVKKAGTAPHEVVESPKPELIAGVSPELPLEMRANGPVLVVDDDPTTREIIESYLTSEGFTVVCASSSEEGLRLARKVKPCAITLDVLMFGMDGWALLSDLKEDPETVDIPVIMLTLAENRALGYALGATEYLTKPVDRERLMAVLGKLLGDGKRSVLVVEDDPETREMLRRVLQKQGCAVQEAENGKVGLERVAEAIPDLILLDLMMPEMDGFQFVEVLRSQDHTRTIPVVVVTAKELTTDEREQLNRHVQVTLEKRAFSRSELLNEVTRQLSALTES